MDENKYLIFIDGTNKTSEILSVERYGQNIKIIFNGNNKEYSYNTERVSIFENPNTIDPGILHIYNNNNILGNIAKILDFGRHMKIFYNSGRISVYPKDALRIERNVLAMQNVKNMLDYLKTLAKSIKSDDNDFLDKQYEKIDYISENSALSTYLQPCSGKTCDYYGTKIFPFGLNLSQEAAVEKALTNQISIIEGPPGTGKTQTILNIIANLLMNNNTVAVVSNNNTAIQNIYDKLDAYGLSFFTAMLGNKENQNNFFVNQIQKYPDIRNTQTANNPKSIEFLENNIIRIKDMLKAYNDLAQASMRLDELKTEKKHFMEMYLTNQGGFGEVGNFLKYKPSTIGSLLAELELLLDKKQRITLFFKIKAFFKYTVFNFALYRHPINEIILFLQKCLYDIEEIKWQKIIDDKQNFLRDIKFEDLLKEYTYSSMELFKTHLLKKYNIDEDRKQFNSDYLWKDFNSFTDEYPVILSTTHSLRSCTQKDFLYDYLIIDEASQVDIVAGGLALSCAKNVIIVGDLKQLPHVVTEDFRKRADDIHQKHCILEAYHYRNSLLASASMVFKDAPRTLLKEHYRCHPKIIDFCNKKFYENELIIFTKECDIEKPLVLVNTADGNHARGKSNQRQIDVIHDEILSQINSDSIGIISPFREQADKLSNATPQELSIEVDTVHKYQGREKDVIVITTVVDDENEFADNPNLLNVAISRAKNQLYIVVSDREKNPNMKDLVNYIKYNNLEIQESKIYSIFDLLYKSYAPHLARYLEKMRDGFEYKSEALMDVVIRDVLGSAKFSNLDCISHYRLKHLLRDKHILNADELAFVEASSHIDFLIFNKISRQTVLAIEVDGVAYHANNQMQLERDKMKDDILRRYSIPVMRFSTNGSNEKQKLLKKLEEVA